MILVVTLKGQSIYLWILHKKNLYWKHIIMLNVHFSDNVHRAHIISIEIMWFITNGLRINRCLGCEALDTKYVSVM